MAVKSVLLYPHPILRQVSALATEEEIHSPDFQQLILDLRDTMYANSGAVGLAAPQVSCLLQLLVFDTTANGDRSDFQVMINPKILSQSKWKYGREGCLSIPDYRGMVKRARKILVTWQDIQGKIREGEFVDFAAVVVQHEVDHLHGVLFLDRLRMIGAETTLTPR